MGIPSVGPQPRSDATVKRPGPPSAAVRPVLRLVRVGNVGVSLAGTVVAGLAANGAGLSLTPPLGAALLLAAGSTACVTAAGNVLNDLQDQQSDRVNHPDRPLVTGAVSPIGARRLCVGLFAAAGLLAAPVALRSPLVIVILALAVASVLAYEMRYKARGFTGNMLVAFLTGAVFLYGGAAVGAIGPVVAFALMAFLATHSREVIKDMEDVAGDVTRRTLPRTRGLGPSAAVARAAVALAIVASPLPFVQYLPLASPAGIIYLALVAVTDALFVASVAWLPSRLHTEQSVSKGAMTLALVAFLTVAFRP